MLAKRIIPCLDVKDGNVVKGIQFQQHKIVGDVIELARYYNEAGADELVFYDITASCDARVVDRDWVRAVAKEISIPFCVAGGIRSVADAKAVLQAGADKISLNSPALERPELITELAAAFGKQSIVVGIDSRYHEGQYKVYQYTGNVAQSKATERLTIEWIREVEERGAGEIVLNCMNQDGMRQGYDLVQLKWAKSQCTLPLIASGGAGSQADFLSVFRATDVEGALAASVFHARDIDIPTLKNFLATNQIEIRQ